MAQQQDQLILAGQPPAMPESDVREEIRLFAEADTPPRLSSAVIDVLIRRCRQADYLNRFPGDPQWRPSFNIARAISEAWLLKQSRTVGMINFESSGQKFSQEQFHKHCGDMAKLWRSRSLGTFNLTGSWRRRLLVPGTYPGVQTNGRLEEDLLF